MKHELFDNFSELVMFALSEDIGHGDITSAFTIPADSIGSFAFTAREDMVFCGTEAIRAPLPTADIKCTDGDAIKKGTVIATISGNVQNILAKERTVLNIIQHLSGIATETAKYVEAVKGTKAKILDTRKTMPILRILQKYAVKCGGGENHRMGLFDMVLIKDNHIKAAGGIEAAVEKARAGINMYPQLKEISERSTLVEVECDTIAQVKEALKAGADIILADNMTGANLKKVVELVGGKALVEASGGVNLKTVRKIAETGVDYISVGALTHSVKAMDIGLDVIS